MIGDVVIVDAGRADLALTAVGHGRRHDFQPTSVGQHLLATVRDGDLLVNIRWPTFVGMSVSDMPRRSDATRRRPTTTRRWSCAYYSNKARLFAAAVGVDLHLPDLTAIPKRHLGRTLVAHFLDRWEGVPLNAGIGLCSSNERFLGAQDAELVPLGISEHGP